MLCQHSGLLFVFIVLSNKMITVIQVRTMKSNPAKMQRKSTIGFSSALYRRSRASFTLTSATATRKKTQFGQEFVRRASSMTFANILIALCLSNVSLNAKQFATTCGYWIRKPRLQSFSSPMSFSVPYNKMSVIAYPLSFMPITLTSMFLIFL